MLSIPEYGWATLKINSFEAPCSYLTDVPVDLLHACNMVLEFGGFYGVHIDSEGLEHLLVLNNSGIWIFSEDENYKTTGPEMPLVDFCVNVYKDIFGNLDAWAHWNLNEDDQIIDKSRDELTCLLNCLCGLLDARGIKV